MTLFVILIVYIMFTESYPGVNTMLKKLVGLLFFSLMIVTVAPTMGEAATPTKTTTKYVNVSSGLLNVRKAPSTSATILSKLSKGAKVIVSSESKVWSKVTANGKSGYVSTKYISANKPGSTSTTTIKAVSTTYKAKAISIAKSNLGIKYRWGGITPSGFDCSGLVKYSYEKAGKTLPRTAADMQKVGKSVSSLQSGDLLFFAPNKGARPTHVSIYIGNGQMIHSASSKGVSIAPVSSSYWKPLYIGAKRI
jgi:cell wall-associated NlpC family hydrolase